MPRYKAVRAPQLIERGFLDALTEKQVWLIRGRVLDTHEGEWAGSDAEAFCEELELYLKMRNPDEHMRVCRGAAEQLRGQPDDDLAEILFDNGIREIKSHEWRFVTGVDTSHLKQNDSITWEEV
jgi:hypothetical protein